MTFIRFAQVMTIASAILLAASVPSTGAQPTAPVFVQIFGADQTRGEAEQVLTSFKEFMQALADRNIGRIGEYLGDNVVAMDSRSQTVISGKQAVLNHIKKQVLNAEPASRLRRVVVYDPFIKVKGDTAMISFRAVKEYGGAHPLKLESWCSEVFELKNDQWKVLHFQSNWKPMRS